MSDLGALANDLFQLPSRQKLLEHLCQGHIQLRLDTSSPDKKKKLCFKVDLV